MSDMYHDNKSSNRQLPPHAYHPNPSLDFNRRAYIAYPIE